MCVHNFKKPISVFTPMKKIAITFCFLLCASSFLFAQSYRTAVGLRLGTGYGSGVAVSVQQRVAKYMTLEGIFQPNFSDNETSFDLLLERHHKILMKRFNIYMGGGLHKDWRPADHENIGKAHAGLVGIIGGEITFKKLNVSWDYKPNVNFLGGDTQLRHQSAITLRMIVVKQKKRKINWKFWKKKDSKKKKRNWKFWEKD